MIAENETLENFENEKNYWIIPMDFNIYPFSEMKKEWDKYKSIKWKIPGEAKYDKNINDYKLIKSSSIFKNLKKRDIIYFYVFNLPMGEKARVLLRGEVVEEKSLMLYKEVYSNSESEEKVYAFKIGNLSTLGEDELYNNFFFTIGDINSKSGSSITNPRGKVWLSRKNNKLSTEQIDILEKYFKKDGWDKDIEKLIKFFNRRCFFEGKIGNKNDHKTFIRKNGLKYYEIHHFIQKNQKNKNKPLHNLKEDDSKAVIYGEKNELTLCPNCHRKIHLGTIEDINEMLKIALEDDGIKEILSSKCIQDVIGGDEEIEKWILEMYNCSNWFIKAVVIKTRLVLWA